MDNTWGGEAAGEEAYKSALASQGFVASLLRVRVAAQEGIEALEQELAAEKTLAEAEEQPLLKVLEESSLRAQLADLVEGRD